MSARYFYLQVDLIGCGVEPLAVRQALQAACAEVFGESGSALPLDVLTVLSSDTGARAVLRAPGAQLVRARAALALAAPALRVTSMSVTRSVTGPGGKDVILVAAPALLAEPSGVALPEPEPAAGLILPDGSINWGCPCLGGMATGPCAQPFRDAFSCFHYSEAEPKGSDCYEKFSEMQACMANYPELYGKDDDDEELALPGADPPPGAGEDPPPGAGEDPPPGAGEVAPPGAGPDPPPGAGPPRGAADDGEPAARDRSAGPAAQARA